MQIITKTEKRTSSQVWGEGALVALSGYREKTNWNETLVGHTTQMLGVRFLLPFPFEVSFINNGQRIAPSIGQVYYAGGDLISGSWEGHDFTFGPLQYDSFVGDIPEGWQVRIQTQENQWDAEIQTLFVKVDEWHLAFELKADGRLALAIGKEYDGVLSRLRTAWETDWSALWSQRKGFFEQLPLPLGHEQVAKKAWSILKVNVESGGEWLPCRWTTPDRIPHKDMWLWDSGFHSLAWNLLDGQMARETLEAILRQADPKTGFIPHQAHPGWRSQITQPPVLAWATWEVVHKHGDVDFARWALPILEGYLRWDEVNRDQNGNGLLEWFIEENLNCRSGESGMDNSPRFDSALNMDAVDFSSFLSHEYSCLSKLAAFLCQKERAESYQRRAELIARKVNDYLYDSEQGFYFDRCMDGEFSKVKACSGFAPLFAGICSSEQAAALVRHLEAPQEFATPVMVPSVACNEPTYSSDMWRGPSWLNWTYMIVCGLERYGYHQLANEICARMVGAVEKWYDQTGTIFEYYDSQNLRSPTTCDRKGPVPDKYDLQMKVPAIRDYNWSAVFYLLMVEKLSK